MDSTIEKLPDRVIVRTGGIETCFGSLESAATQIASLQQEIVRLQDIAAPPDPGEEA